MKAKVYFIQQCIICSSTVVISTTNGFQFAGDAYSNCWDEHHLPWWNSSRFSSFYWPHHSQDSLFQRDPLHPPSDSWARSIDKTVIDSMRSSENSRIPCEQSSKGFIRDWFWVGITSASPWQAPKQGEGLQGPPALRISESWGLHPAPVMTIMLLGCWCIEEGWRSIGAPSKTRLGSRLMPWNWPLLFVFTEGGVSAGPRNKPNPKTPDHDLSWLLVMVRDVKPLGECRPPNYPNMNISKTVYYYCYICSKWINTKW